MTTTTVQHREHDHKSWLNDIERWNYDIGVWENHSETMRKDAQAVVAAVEQFINSVEEHKTGVSAIRKQILDCERETIEHKHSEEEAAAGHQKVGSEHKLRCDCHKSLEKQRHDLMTMLSSLKNECSSQQP